MVAFPNGASDALAHQIDPDAARAGVGLGVGDKKMAVATADFQHEVLVRWQDARDLGDQFRFALFHPRMMRDNAGAVFHDEMRPKWLGGASSAVRFKQHHENTYVGWVHSAYAARLTERHGFELCKFQRALAP